MGCLLCSRPVAGYVHCAILFDIHNDPASQVYFPIRRVRKMSLRAIKEFS